MPDLKNIKIMFIDIDGTLTNDEKEISEYTQSVINKAVENGIYVIITSGRTTDYVVSKSKLSKASNIVISNNGATIFDYNRNETIFNSKFSREILEKIFEFIKNLNVECTLNSTYKRYRTNKLGFSFSKNVILMNDISDIIDEVSQLVFDSYNYDDINAVKDFFEKMEKVEISNISENLQENIKVLENQETYWFDLVLKGNNKGNAIENLLKYLNIDKKDSICFGDQINDCKMFEAVGIKVAMENGMKELKEKADFIALSNNEDGVAKFIEENIL